MARGFLLPERIDDAPLGGLDLVAHDAFLDVGLACLKKRGELPQARKAPLFFAAGRDLVVVDPKGGVTGRAREEAAALTRKGNTFRFELCLRMIRRGH